jgi:NAD(P)-dependent dehydrogenase (short-subunit alcohol dehydrogenase family)
MVDTAVRAFGKLDILVNNAGILRDKTLLKTEPADWGAVIAVHLTGAYNVTRPAFVAMREHQYGRIICATSAAGLYGNFGQCNYSAAKLGLVGFMNTLKLEGKKFGILANAVAPIAATRMTEDVFPPDFMETLKPEHIAPLVLFLGSEQCDVSGMIFNAGMGRFGRAAIMTAPGVILSEGRPSQPEDIAARFEEIMSLDGAEEFHDAQQALGSWLSPTR